MVALLVSRLCQDVVDLVDMVLPCKVLKSSFYLLNFIQYDI